MNREEIQPETIPNAIGIAKLRSDVKPKNSETTTIITTAIKVVTVVTIFLVLTTFTLILTSSAVGMVG